MIMIIIDFTQDFLIVSGTDDHEILGKASPQTKSLVAEIQALGRSVTFVGGNGPMSS